MAAKEADAQTPTASEPAVPMHDGAAATEPDADAAATQESFAIGAGSVHDGGRSTVLHLGDSGRSIELAVGATLTVELKANHSTGYGWDVIKNGGKVVALTGPASYAAGEGQPGAPGLQTFSFVARAAGKTRIELLYRRPWEHGRDAGDSGKTFAVDVTVK